MKPMGKILSKNILSNFLDKILRTLRLNAKKILKWYSIILLVAPLLYAAFLQLTVLKTKQPIAIMMSKQPMIAVSIIIAFIDFLLGYYCWIKNKEILSDSKGYRSFMICQMICQLLLGNIFCFVLGALGIHASSQLETSSNTRSTVNSIVTLVSTILLGGCVILVYMIGIRG